MKYFLVLVFVSVTCCKAQLKYPEGGFAYPEHIADSDTIWYHYPLKDIVSKKDAFYAHYEHRIYQLFNEPNLSTQPQSHETFRFYYKDQSGISIILLTKDSIIVKRGNLDTIHCIDTSRLSPTENLHLDILKRRFPLDDTTGKSLPVRKYLDSMVRLYPQLLDTAYFYHLYDRITVRNDKPFVYEETKVSITEQQYNLIIEQLNTSGFWSMPYRLMCNNHPTESGYYELEANTKTKYQMVSANDCLDDTTRFISACQNIINLAKLDREICLIWNEGNDNNNLNELTPIKQTRKKKKNQH